MRWNPSFQRLNLCCCHKWGSACLDRVVLHRSGKLVKFFFGMYHYYIIVRYWYLNSLVDFNLKKSSPLKYAHVKNDTDFSIFIWWKYLASTFLLLDAIYGSFFSMAQHERMKHEVTFLYLFSLRGISKYLPMLYGALQYLPYVTLIWPLITQINI